MKGVPLMVRARGTRSATSDSYMFEYTHALLAQGLARPVAENLVSLGGSFAR
jgi:hypothetical protein